jgi:hypothetical protein
MADIVVGIASSHTPQLSSGVDMWPDHADRDRRNPWLLGKDAQYCSYDDLLAIADPAIKGELDPVVWDAKYARCQAAIAALAGLLGSSGADVAVVIGDDQRELFLDDGIPALACFAGDDLVDIPPAGEALERMPKGIRAAMWARYSEHPERFPVSTDLARHLAEELTAADFDITLCTEQPAGRGLGHAFTFARYRLGLPAATPIVPVFVNTYYQPNVPSAGRCYALGRAVRRAVQSWEANSRVAVIASGGLSHFVIDEDLDSRVLSGITHRDPGVLGSLPRAQLRSGNSEILNWIAAAGALEGLAPTVLDYVPGYRTPAGTGAGMAFAEWH